MQISYTIKKDCPYQTIKQLLKQEFNMSDRLILKLKTNKRIFLNNSLAYVNELLNIGDIIFIDMDFDEDNSNIKPTNNSVFKR